MVKRQSFIDRLQWFFINSKHGSTVKARTIIVPHNKLYLIKVIRRSFHLNGQTLDCHPHQARITWDSRLKKKTQHPSFECVLFTGVMIGIPSHLIANSAICIYMIAHTYIWLHNIQNLVTTAFVKYNDTKFKWSILTYLHNFRVLLFQYSLNSRFSICNSGQTSTRRLFREKNLGESFC